MKPRKGFARAWANEKLGVGGSNSGFADYLVERKRMIKHSEFLLSMGRGSVRMVNIPLMRETRWDSLSEPLSSSLRKNSGAFLLMEE